MCRISTETRGADLQLHAATYRQDTQQQEEFRVQRARAFFTWKGPDLELASLDPTCGVEPPYLIT